MKIKIDHETHHAVAEGSTVRTWASPPVEHNQMKDKQMKHRIELDHETCDDIVTAVIKDHYKMIKKQIKKLEHPESAPLLEYQERDLKDNKHFLKGFKIVMEYFGVPE